MHRSALGIIAAVVGAMLPGTATLTRADAERPGEHYTPRTFAGAEGIGKRYMDREIAGVMGWQGAAWLEREEREREAAVHALVWERTVGTLPWQRLVLFRKRD